MSVLTSKRAVVALLLLLSAGGGEAVKSVSEASTPAPVLMVSGRGDRAAAVPLQGSSVVGAVHVFLADAPRSATVRYWLDQPTSSVPRQVERKAPYDLAGGSPGRANPVDSGRLSRGSHRLVAEVVEPGRTRTLTATFTTDRSAQRLLVSRTADRRVAVPVDGSRLSGRVYLFLTGSARGPVRFWLDRAVSAAPTQVEDKAPYDLMGGSVAAAHPLDTTRLAAGRHTVVAGTSSGAGPVRVSAAFTTTSGSGAAAQPVRTVPSPSPSPSATAAPPAAPAADAEDRSAPSGTAGVPDGWPGAATTGVRSGTSLRTVGAQVVTQHGAVLEGLRVEGCVDVQADDVVIRNSVITCGRDGAVVKNRGARLLLEDVEVDGAGRSSSCVASGGFTLLRVEVRGCADGVRANNDVTIRDSWVHDLARRPESHNDAVQTTQGSRIRLLHNTLTPYRSDTRDPMNAAYILGEDQGPISDVIVQDNYVNGGNYTFMLGRDIEGMVVVGNRFGRDHRYGPVNSVPDGTTWRDNTYADDRSPVR